MTQPNGFAASVYGSPLARIGFYVDEAGNLFQVTLNSAGQQVIVNLSAANGAATGNAIPQPLGTAVAGTDPLASHQDHVHALPTAPQINAFGLPGNWDASRNTPTLSSGTPPSTYNSFTVTVAGATTLDGVSTWNVGDDLFFGLDGIWHRIAGAPVTNNLFKGDGAGGFLAAAPGIDYTPGPVIQCGIPVANAPSGTMADNGVFTAGTAFPQTYSLGIWLYFQAAGVLSGSLGGLYYCIASSSTVLQVTTSYIAVSTSGMGAVGKYDRPSSPVNVSGTGPGSYTGFVGTFYLPGVKITGGYMLANGTANAKTLIRANNSGTAKIVQVCLGNGSTLGTINSSVLNSGVNGAQVATDYNRGLQNAQIVPSAQDSSVFGVTNATIDTSVDQYIQARITVANAVDTVILEAIQVTVIPFP